MHLRFVTRVHFAAALFIVSLLTYSMWIIPSLNMTTRLAKAWSGSPKIVVVVFGDSLSDTGRHADDTSGAVAGLSTASNSVRWTEALCKDLACAAVLNFARSAAGQTPYSGGVVADNDVYANTTTQKASSLALLPDLKEQIRAWIKYEKESGSVEPDEEYVFAITVGFWDIWQYATLELQAAQNAIANSIAAIFAQMDIIADSFEEPVSFVVPQLWDVSFTPRFMSLGHDHDSQPRRYSEMQHELIYLIKYWNTVLVQTGANWNGGYLFQPDWNSWLLDQIRSVQMKKLGLFDSLGLGTETAAFKDVLNPCLTPVVPADATEELVAVSTETYECENPGEHLFWDDVQFSAVAHELLGAVAAAQMGSNAAINLNMEIRSSHSNVTSAKQVLAMPRLAPSLAPGN